MEFKIYKIAHKTNHKFKCYIGSTGKTLINRFKQHIYLYNYNKEHNLPSTLTIHNLFDMDNIDNFEIILLDETNDINKRYELEGIYIRYHNSINKNIMNRTRYQYYRDNLPMIVERRKTQIVCSCGDLYTYSHKARHKQTLTHLLNDLQI